MPGMQKEEGEGIMAHYKWFAEMLVPWKWYYNSPKYRLINVSRAIEMVGKSNLRKFKERTRGNEC